MQAELESKTGELSLKGSLVMTATAALEELNLKESLHRTTAAALASLVPLQYDARSLASEVADLRREKSADLAAHKGVLESLEQAHQVRDPLLPYPSRPDRLCFAG